MIENPRIKNLVKRQFGDKAEFMRSGGESYVFQMKKHPLVLKVPYTMSSDMSLDKTKTSKQKRARFATDFLAYKLLGPELAAKTYFDKRHNIEVQEYLPRSISSDPPSVRRAKEAKFYRMLKSRGIKHGDLGGHNIRMDANGSWKVIDFGGIYRSRKDDPANFGRLREMDERMLRRIAKRLRLSHEERKRLRLEW